MFSIIILSALTLLGGSYYVNKYSYFPPKETFLIEEMNEAITTSDYNKFHSNYQKLSSCTSDSYSTTQALKSIQDRLNNQKEYTSTTYRSIKLQEMAVYGLLGIGSGYLTSKFLTNPNTISFNDLSSTAGLILLNVSIRSALDFTKSAYKYGQAERTITHKAYFTDSALKLLKECSTKTQQPAFVKKQVEQKKLDLQEILTDPKLTDSERSILVRKALKQS